MFKSFSRWPLFALTFFVIQIPASQSALGQTYSVFYSFTGGSGTTGDGEDPNGNLVQDSDGNLYGTTSLGGGNTAGTIFKIDPAGVETILYSFSDPVEPQAGLFRDPDGNLYGTTYITGDPNCEGVGCGTIFKLDTSNTLTVLHTFEEVDGSRPMSRMVSVNGELYGTTQFGGGTSCNFGLPGCGVVFKISKAGKYSVLYRFAGGADGSNPNGNGLFRDAAGNLYGSTSAGGAGGQGTVYKLDTAGHFTLLYTFTGGSDGGDPRGRVIVNSAGVIYGTTQIYGGTTCQGGCGVVYRLTQSGHESVLHHFGGVKGKTPEAGVLDVGGVIYGTTISGGDTSCNNGAGCGVLYKIDKSGAYSVVHALTVSRFS